MIYAPCASHRGSQRQILLKIQLPEDDVIEYKKDLGNNERALCILPNRKKMISADLQLYLKT